MAGGLSAAAASVPMLDLVPPQYRAYVPLILGVVALYAILKRLYEKNVAEAPRLHYLPTGPNRALGRPPLCFRSRLRYSQMICAPITVETNEHGRERDVCQLGATAEQ